MHNPTIILMGGLATALGSGAAVAQELRIFTFEGYTDAAWVEPFEEATGCEVNATYTGSVDEMFAKMVGSEGADYDLISIDTSLFGRYIEQGLLKPYDMSKIANTENLLPAFQNVEEARHGGETYGVPIAWGSLGLIYDTEAIPGGVDSWQALWNPDYANQILVLDDANNNIVNTAILLGFEDPFNLSDEQFQAVKEKLIEQKQYLISYYAGFEEGVNIWDNSNAALMFSMGEFQAVELEDRGYEVVYTIPEEGGVGWLDTWAMSAGVQNENCAHAWVNWFLDPTVGQQMTEAYGYGNTTTEAEGLDYAGRLTWLAPVEDFDRRVELWNEVKAAPVP